MLPSNLQTLQPHLEISRDKQPLFTKEMLQLLDNAILTQVAYGFLAKHFFICTTLSVNIIVESGKRRILICAFYDLYIHKKNTGWVALSSKGIIGPISLQEKWIRFVTFKSCTNLWPSFKPWANPLKQLGSFKIRTGEVFIFIEECVDVLDYHNEMGNGMDHRICQKVIHAISSCGFTWKL